MKIREIAGWPGWILHRLFASYWLLAVLAVIAAIPFAGGLLWLDRAGATQWLIAQDLASVATSDTAKDFAGVAAGVNAAFIALYFSITLIVLSMASGNLGVRLIDRWIERRLIRVSIAGLSFAMVVSLFAMLAIDGEAPLEDTPLLLIASVFALQVVNVAMLAVSLHDLGRTMFVDTSVHALARDASARSIRLASVPREGCDWTEILRAPREGYVENVDIEKLRRIADDTQLRFRVEVAPGQHVLENQPMLRASGDFDRSSLQSAIAIGDYRSDAQGVVFRVRLLVEIAARALSPAINDFYTALACADKLAAVIESQTDTWIDRECDPAFEGCERLVLVGQDFRGLFEDPLSAFRQAACQYPSVSIRMIGSYARIAKRIEAGGGPGELVTFLRDLAAHLRDHAASVTDFEIDRRDIHRAYDEGFGFSQEASNEGASGGETHGKDKQAAA